jgi:hypothetical protein
MDIEQLIASGRKIVVIAAQKITKRTNVKVRNTLAVDARATTKLGLSNVPKGLPRDED